MCLTTHFTAKLLKSCAVYTPTFEYLSSGQFNYPGPSVISAALLSLSFARGMRDLFAASLRYGGGSGLQGAKINKKFIPAQVSHTLFSLPPPYIYRYCTHPFSYKVI